MEKEKLYDKWTATGLETIKACVEDKIANYCELNKKQCQEVLNLIEKQQKEIEKLKSRKYIFNAKTQELKEIPISDEYIIKEKRKFNQIYGRMVKQQKELEELKHFKEEVIDIIKYADDTAEPTYWNIRKLLGLGE